METFFIFSTLSKGLLIVKDALLKAFGDVPGSVIVETGTTYSEIVFFARNGSPNLSLK